MTDDGQAKRAQAAAFDEWFKTETCEVHWDNSPETNARYGWEAAMRYAAQLADKQSGLYADADNEAASHGCSRVASEIRNGALHMGAGAAPQSKHTCQELRPNDSVSYSDGPCMECAKDKGLATGINDGPPNSICMCGRGVKCPIHRGGAGAASVPQEWRECLRELCQSIVGDARMMTNRQRDAMVRAERLLDQGGTNAQGH